MLTTWQWVFNLHPTSFVNQGIPILIQGFPGGAVDELTDENGQSEKMRCTIPNQKLYQNAQKCPKARKNQPFLTGFTGADTQIRTGDLILTKDALYRLSYISIKRGNGDILHPNRKKSKRKN